MKARLTLQTLCSVLLLEALLLVDYVKGLPKCPETCPKMLYLNKRKEGNFSFPPCEDQRCNICEEGRQLEIEELQCDDSLVTGCSPNEGMVNIRISHDLPVDDGDPLTVLLTINKYTCTKGGTISTMTKPIMIPVQLNVIEVKLTIPGGGLEESKSYLCIRGEEISMDCKVRGHVPSDGSILTYFHHGGTSNQLACSDHPQEKRDDSVIHGTTKIINRTVCELDIDNCDTFDSGRYFCHVYITGIMDTNMQEFSSENINITVSNIPGNSNINIILETAIPAAAVVIALLVIVPVVIVLAIKCRRPPPAPPPPPPVDAARNNPDEEGPLLNQRHHGPQQRYGSTSEPESLLHRDVHQGYPYSDSDLSRVNSPVLSLYETDTTDSGNRPRGEIGSRPLSFPSNHYSAVISKDQSQGANEDESDLGCGFMSEPYTHRHRNRHTTRPPKSSLPNRMTGSNSAYTRYTSPPEPLPQSPLAVQSTVPDTKPGGETRPSTATSMPDLEDESDFGGDRPTPEHLSPAEFDQPTSPRMSPTHSDRSVDSKESSKNSDISLPDPEATNGDLATTVNVMKTIDV